MLKWNRAQPEFYRDGSLRDVYVLGTAIEDWQRVLDSLRESVLSCRYYRSELEVPLPRTAGDAFPEAGELDRLLVVDLGGVTAHAHFFAESEIEFDLDPREVSGQAQLDAIVEFMKMLAGATGKDAILTPEASGPIDRGRFRPR